MDVTSQSSSRAAVGAFNGLVGYGVIIANQAFGNTSIYTLLPLILYLL